MHQQIQKQPQNQTITRSLSVTAYLGQGRSGTLGMRWLYTLDRMLVHHKASQKHTSTHSFTSMGNISIHLLACAWEVGRNRRTWRKPRHTKGEHAKKPHTDSNPSSRLNLGFTQNHPKPNTQMQIQKHININSKWKEMLIAD